MQKIWLTGSNGFIGQKLLNAFLAMDKYQILATSRGENRFRSAEGYQYESVDVCQYDALGKVMQTFRPEIVYHTVALAQVETCEQDPDRAQAVNVQPVKHLVDLCSEFDCKLVFFSTDFVFDGRQGPYRESDGTNPLNVYGQSKLLAEQYIQESNIAWAIIRTILVFGVPHDTRRMTFPLWVKSQLENGKQIKVVTDHIRMPTLVEDLVDACIEIFRQRREGVYHISGAQQLSMYEFAQQVADFWDLDVRLIEPVRATDLPSPAERPESTGFILEKASRELGFSPRSLQESLKFMKQQLSAR